MKNVIIFAALGTLLVTDFLYFKTNSVLAQSPSDTCIQGYVWREAFPSDHVCVTPETREQAAYDNSQASDRIDPDNQTYGPDTCIQGYVWREAFPSDHVCVTPETREQTAYDNSQVTRRVIVQAPAEPSIPPSTRILRGKKHLSPHIIKHYTTVPPTPGFPKFLGLSTNSKEESLIDALSKARRSLGGQYANAMNDELKYREINQDSGFNGSTWVSWVIIELESNSDYHPIIDCPQPEDPGLGRSCQPLPSACYFRDPSRCPRR
jgi:hypothetical protein